MTRRSLSIALDSARALLAARPVLALSLLLIVLAGAAFVGAADPAASTRYVAPGGSDGANGCLDPAAPCVTLAHALGRALPGDTIQLAPGDYREAGLRVVKPVTLRGADAATTRLDGQGRETLLTVADGAALTLEGLTLRGGRGRLGGAVAVEAGGSLVARRVALAANRADWGGGVYLAGGTAVIDDSSLTGNTAEGGGAVFIAAGNLTMTRTGLSDNEAALGGGLMAGPAATVNLARAILRDNRAARLGGGAYVQGTLHAINTLWRDNEAGDRGGGLLSDGGAATLDHSAWLSNAAALGGGIAGDGTLRLRNSVITGNSGGDCAATLEGSDNLLGDGSCGLPARPATGLAADGRPAAGSNAIDGVPAGRCLTGGGAAVSEDWRGEPRPADGNRDGSALCDIGPYEFQPHLVILHAPTLTDGALFAFSGDLGGFELVAPGRTWQAFEASPGSTLVTQARKTGWKLTGLSCVGDSDGGSLLDVKARAATVDLDPGETIICTFTTRATRGSLGVAVVAGAPLLVPFDGDLGAFDLRTPDRPDRRGGKLAPGVYTVAAQPPAGWRVTAIACDGDGDGGSAYDPALGLAHIDLDNKETLNCVFTLGRVSTTGTLTIRHEATPADDATFTYTGDVGPLSLRAISRPSTSLTLPAGIYRVHELLHPFWMLNDIACAGDGDEGTVTMLETATAVIDLDAGEAITCVFRHGQPDAGTGSITLIQSTAAAEPVTFTYSGALGAFTLALPDTATRAWPALTPGSYTVTQAPVAGWRLDAITCTGDADGGSMLAPGAATATIDLDANESIVCTFANSLRATGQGSLTIVHAPVPADDTGFRYTGVFGDFILRSPSQPGQSFAGLAAGGYPVTVRLPDGWHASGIDCAGDGDAGSIFEVVAGRVIVDLDAKEAITCTFRPTRDDAPPPVFRLVFVPILRR